MSEEEREALVDIIFYILASIYPLAGQIPERIQRDIAIIQGEQSDE